MAQEIEDGLNEASFLYDEKYVRFLYLCKLAETGNTPILSSNANDVSSMVAQADKRAHQHALERKQRVDHFKEFSDSISWISPLYQNDEIWKSFGINTTEINEELENSNRNLEAGVCKNKDQVESFDGLPDLPLLNIFKFLPVADLYRCMRVCRRWFYLTRVSSLWRKVDIEVNDYDSTKLHHQDVLEVLQFSAPNIEKLRINGRNRFHWNINFSEFSKTLKESCPALQYFFFHNAAVTKCFCSKQDSLFKHLPESVRVLSLRDIMFPFNCLISTENDTLFPNIESFEFLIHNQPLLLKQAVLSASKMVNLQELRLSNCFSLTDEDVLCLTGIISNLVVLDLECTKVKSGTFNLLKQFAQRLEKLYIGLTSIDDDDVNFDEEDCFPNLKEICLVSTALSMTGVIGLLESCQNLKRVYHDRKFYEARDDDEVSLRLYERMQYVAFKDHCDHSLNFNSI